MNSDAGKGGRNGLKGTCSSGLGTSPPLARAAWDGLRGTEAAKRGADTEWVGQDRLGQLRQMDLQGHVTK